jgi:hypothetical protein
MTRRTLGVALAGAIALTAAAPAAADAAPRSLSYGRALSKMEPSVVRMANDLGADYWNLGDCFRISRRVVQCTQAFDFDTSTDAPMTCEGNIRASLSGSGYVRVTFPGEPSCA